MQFIQIRPNLILRAASARARRKLFIRVEVYRAALYTRMHARTTVIAITALSRLTSPTGGRYYAAAARSERGRTAPTERASARGGAQCTRRITCAGDPNFAISSIGPYTRARPRSLPKTAAPCSAHRRRCFRSISASEDNHEREGGRKKEKERG